MRRTRAVILLAPFLLAAEPDDGSAPATKADIDALRAEVAELRELMVRELEVEDLRLSGLRTVLGEARGTRRRDPPPLRPGDPSTKKDPSDPGTSAQGGTRGAATATRPRLADPGALSGAGPGSISGRVTLRGGARDTAAYVYVEDISGKLAKNKSLEVKQIEKQFVPRSAVVERGTRVVFPNQDKILHNVFSLTPGSSFDLGSYQAGDKPGSVVLTQPGVVEIFCNLHAEMTASILVVPSSHHTRIAADGRFVLKDVPPGNHKVVAWTPNSAPVSQAVTVPPGQDATVELTLLANLEPPRHKDKNGMPYSSYP